MRYLGGKTRLAKEICAAILNDTDARDTYIEPFIGGGSTFFETSRHFEHGYAGDVQEDLVLMWQGLVKGTFVPPLEVSEGEWRDLKYAAPSALRGFVGFGCSFAGRFYNGYARNKGGTNYAAQSARSVQRDLSKVEPSRVTVKLADYRDWTPRQGDVVYCDPPYQGTLQYSSPKTGVDEFIHDEFWDLMREWRSRGVHVYVSEFSAPSDWEVIWEKNRRVGTGTQKNARYVERTDKLFK